MPVTSQGRASSRCAGALVIAAATFALLFVVARGSFAQDRSGLQSAQAAMSARNYRSAIDLYTAALNQGGLTQKDLLDSYVNMAIAHHALGAERSAKAAFSKAVLIDARFLLPPNATRGERDMADEARRTAAQTGGFQLQIEVPESVPPSKGFQVRVTMAATHLDLISKVRLVAIGSEWEQIKPAATSVSFDIPATVVVADQRISLRVQALDEHNNRLAGISAHDVDVTSPTTSTTSPTGTSNGADAGAPPHDEKVETNAEKDEKDEAEGTGTWSVPSGSKKYVPVRTTKAPKIDGLLDDEVWVAAPQDSAFSSTKSKPYGQPTKEGTTVQVAYDAENLYVAFRCAYSKSGAKDDSFAQDEDSLLAESEHVAVLVDATHGRTNAFEFAVSRVGARADAELTEHGSEINEDWHGIWESGTHRSATGWTAEFRIPWGTMRMPSHEAAFDIGINFARREPTSGEYALWALHPPATENFDTSFFGDLVGLTQVHPGQRLYLEPYFALAADAVPMPQSPLTDFANTGSSGVRFYAGLYARYRPPGPVRFDATFNPDFSAVNPDQARANFDRFELEFPENRPFFAEDNPRFQFGGTRFQYGDLGAQLFYSRRFGIDTSTPGLTEAVPILWGVKSVLQTGGTEAALMNIETSPANQAVALDDNMTVGRVTQMFLGQRIGAIFLNRTGDSGQYTAGGADLKLALYDRHLQISGFFAGASSAAGSVFQTTGTVPPLGTVFDMAGSATVAWKSQDFYAQVQYLDVGDSFEAPLGYFPITGVRAETFAAGYTPVLRSDLVQQLFLEGQLSLASNRDTDARIYDRGVVSASIETIQQAMLQVAVAPATEDVLTAFPIGNGRITIQPGEYKVMVAQMDLASPQRSVFVWGLGFSGGDLFDGKSYSPSLTLGLNLGRFAARAKYTMFLLSYDGDRFTGHELDASLTFAYSPRAKTSILIDANSVAARAVAQMVTSVELWTATRLTLTLRGTSGSTVDVLAQDIWDTPNFTAILSLNVGVSPF